MIDRFDAVTDCITPDPRRAILSYQVSDVMRVRIEAIHRGGRSRTFYSQGGRSVVPSMGATGIADPGAALDVEAYVLIATGALDCFIYKPLQASSNHSARTREVDFLAHDEIIRSR